MRAGFGPVLRTARWEAAARSSQLIGTSCITVLALTGCAAHTAYHPPQVATASNWRAETPWRPANPTDRLSRGSWWEMFSDPDLSSLEQQVLEANQTVAAARQRVEQARASASLASASLFPQVSAGF